MPIRSTPIEEVRSAWQLLFKVLDNYGVDEQNHVVLGDIKEDDYLAKLNAMSSAVKDLPD